MKQNKNDNERKFVGGNGEMDEIHNPFCVMVNVCKSPCRQYRNFVVHDAVLKMKGLTVFDCG